MSVVVRMEMPKSCSWVENGEKKKCPMAEWGVACSITKKFEMPNGTRPDWCPIICALPEGHGRLVEESEVTKMVNKWFDTIGLNPDILIDSIKSLPTIVPAEIAPVIPDPLPIRGVEYVPTEVDAQTGTVTYELRERSEHS